MTPQGWEEKTLGEITISVCNGTSAPQCKKVTNYPVTRIETIATSKINLDKVGYIDSCSEDFINKYKMEYGDILFSNINSDIHLGKTAIYEIPKGILLHGMNLLNIRVNKKLINPFYLNYYFIYLRFLGSFIRMASRSVNQSSINQTKLKALKISYPSLPEQERIVAKLDEAFEAIDKAKANAEQNLTNAKELFESYVNEFYTKLSLSEKQCQISDIAKIKGGKRVPKGYKLISEKTAYPYIRVADFDDYGSVDLSDIHYINEDIYQQIKNYTISTKDLYISIAGTIGKSGIIPNVLEGANLTENACKLVLGDDVYNKFVYYFTKTRYFIYETQTKTRTAAQPKLALSRLATIEIPLPDISTQQQIVEKLDALQEQTRQLEQIYTQKIKECDELKQSILQKAFRGEL